MSARAASARIVLEILVGALIFIAFAVAIVGCGPGRPPGTPAVDLEDWPNGPAVAWRGHSIVCPSSIAAEDSAAIARVALSVELQVEAWESDEGRELPPTRFGIVLGSCECGHGGPGSGRDFSGCWRAPRLIVATAGPRLDCWPIYHELGHELLYETNGDPDASHSDPRWLVWARRGAELEAARDEQ